MNDNYPNAAFSMLQTPDERVWIPSYAKKNGVFTSIMMRVKGNGWDTAYGTVANSLGILYGAKYVSGISYYGINGANCNYMRILSVGPDKMYVGGLLPSYGCWFPLRLNNIDNSCDTNWKFKLAGTNRTQNLHDLIMAPDSSVFIIGHTNYAFPSSSDTQKMIVIKYKKNGTRDSSYGVNGMVETALGRIGMWAYSAELLSNGNLLIAGKLGGNSMFARLLPNGQFDPSFGANGIAQTFLGHSSKFIKMIRRPNGKVVVVTNDEGIIGGAENRAYVWQFVPYCSKVDSSFGENGVCQIRSKAFSAATPYETYVSDMVLQADGKLVLAGTETMLGYTTHAYDTGSPCVYRITASGRPDSSFGINGSTFLYPHMIGHGASTIYTGHLYSVLIQQDGSILVGGDILKGASTSVDWSIVLIKLKNKKPIVTGIAPINKSTSSLQVFPNPTEGLVSFIISSKTACSYTLDITDATGRLIKQVMNGSLIAGDEKKSNYDLSEILSPGIYFLNLRTSDGSAINRKLLKL